jgi:hypothetical protein
MARPERARPAPRINQPTSEQAVHAAEAMTAINRVLDEAMTAVSGLLAGIDNPLERARAAEQVLHGLRGDRVAGPTQVRRAAMREAYERGRTVSGKYGFGALADDLGTMSKARVQQILTGPGSSVEDEGAPTVQA